MALRRAQGASNGAPGSRPLAEQRARGPPGAGDAPWGLPPQAPGRGPRPKPADPGTGPGPRTRDPAKSADSRVALDRPSDPVPLAMPATLTYLVLVPAPRPATPAGMAGFSGRHDRNTHRR